jgi:hypothetical protein
LFYFNVGVEIGQVIFVAFMLVVIALLKRLPTKLPHWAPCVTPYAIGGAATFWVLERVTAFWQ